MTHHLLRQGSFANTAFVKMTGQGQSQEHTQASPGSSGISGEHRPGSSLRYQHQMNDTDRPTPATPSRKHAASKTVNSNVTPEEISALTNSLGAARLQGLRVANFAFEPVSLPASRVSFNVPFCILLAVVS